MFRPLALCLALTLAIGSFPGCMPNVLPFAGIGSRQGSASVLEGKLILPYAVPENRVSHSSSIIRYFLGEPALADPPRTYLVFPLTRQDLSVLHATVDGQPVDLEIRRISFGSDQTIIEYRIDSLPLVDINEVYTVEILTRDGYPVLGGVVRFTPGTVIVQDLDVRTTAILVKVKEKHGRLKIKDISLAEIRVIELDPTLLVEQDSIRVLLRRDGTLRDHFFFRVDLDDDDFDHDFDDDDREGRGNSGKGKGHDKD